MNKSTIDATEPARDFVSASAFDPHDTADIRYFNNLLAGRYSVLRLLASGEDSSHYLARTAEHNLLVELELLSDEAARDGRKVELFCSEAQAAARLSHKNIVSASLDRRVDPAYVIVSRYNSGLVTLRDLLDRKSVPSSSRACPRDFLRSRLRPSTRGVTPSIESAESITRR
jgi:serine/threonine protein kinase